MRCRLPWTTLALAGALGLVGCGRVGFDVAPGDASPDSASRTGGAAGGDALVASEAAQGAESSPDAAAFDRPPAIAADVATADRPRDTSAADTALTPDRPASDAPATDRPAAAPGDAQGAAVSDAPEDAPAVAGDAAEDAAAVVGDTPSDVPVDATEDTGIDVAEYAPGVGLDVAPDLSDDAAEDAAPDAASDTSVDQAIDAAADSTPDTASTCSADPHDYSIATPYGFVAVAGRAAILYRGAGSELWVRSVDPAGTDYPPVLVATSSLGYAAVIPGFGGNEVIVTHQALSNGWNAAQGVLLDVTTSAFNAQNYYEPGHHHAFIVPVLRSGIFALMFEDEVRPMGLPTYYRIRVDRRTSMTTRISTATRQPTFRSVATVGTSSGFVALAEANPNTAIHNFNTNGEYVAGRGSVAGDLVKFVTDAAAPTLLRSTGGGLDLIPMSADGTQLAPRSIEAAGGPAITIGSALEAAEGTYVSWSEGGAAQATLATATTTKTLASRAGASGGIWLARIGAFTYRATDVGTIVTVERLCP